MTSHSMTLLSTRPQLIPGMSLSDCICLSCRPRRPAAAVLAMVEEGGRWRIVVISKCAGGAEGGLSSGNGYSDRYLVICRGSHKGWFCGEVAKVSMLSDWRKVVD